MKTLPNELLPYQDEIIQGKESNNSKWILFPKEENWEKETEIYWNPCPYNEKYYSEQNQLTPKINLKEQHTMMVDGMLTGFTKPFMVYQDENGDFTKYGDHPLLEEKESQLKPIPMSYKYWRKLVGKKWWQF